MKHIVRKNDAAEVFAFSAFMNANLINVNFDKSKDEDDIVKEFEAKLPAGSTGIVYSTLLFYVNDKNELIAWLVDEEACGYIK